jgi:hypothetical protein
MGITPGNLVYLRPKGYASPSWAIRPQVRVDESGMGVIIKSLGKDPNERECFEVLVKDRVLMVWEDEIVNKEVETLTK